jgi:hypothetical protein
MFVPMLRQAPVIAAGAIPLLLQLGVTYAQTGRVGIASPQQAGYHTHEVFYWTEPALLKTIASSRHGLFFWSPALLVSLAGLVSFLCRGGWRNAWVVGLAIGGLLLWYVNSAWWCWAFGTSFGSRAFVDIAAVFIVGFALAFDQLAGAGRTLRVVVIGFVGLSIVYSYGMMGLYIVKKLPRDDFLLPRPGIKPPTGLDSYYRPINPDDPQGSGDE